MIRKKGDGTGLKEANCYPCKLHRRLYRPMAPARCKPMPMNALVQSRKLDEAGFEGELRRHGLGLRSSPSTADGWQKTRNMMR